MSARGAVFGPSEPAGADSARVTLFLPPEAGFETPRPSLLLASTPTWSACAPGGRETPEPARDAAGARWRIRFPHGTSFFGMGELAGGLERSGRRARLWNTDSFQYDERNAELYQSHPYVLALRADGSAVGWLADTIRRGTLVVEVGAEESTLEFAFEAEPFALLCLEGAHPAAVTRALAELVGRIDLPPLWALGYHQCRWSYLSAEELRALAAEFRRRGIPCDGLWFDIDYMERFRVFTVDAERFPDFAGLTRELEQRGFQSVAILDPGVAVDSELAREGLAGGHFVRDEHGVPAVGSVWPGACHFPDFTSAAVRAWWSDHVQAFVARTGLAGLWNDMNEPAVLDGPGKTLPETCRHEGTDGSGGDHARWHNLYGQLMLAATRDGLVRARPEHRPFLLTRANHVSGARLGATWTGDNRATWEHLRWSIPMVLNLGLSGQPFAGPDVGGFSDNPDTELFTRWFELGALLPFFRGHAEKSSRRKEPWAFDAATEALVRAAIERRMKLLPTLYTLFREASAHGLPVARPLFFADPTDARLAPCDDAFLLGEDLLVAPVVHARARERAVLFPRHPGGWFPFPAGGGAIHEEERLVPAPLGTLPLFARAGSILFENEPRPSTATPARLLVVHVFLDEAGRARGRLYEDEGEGHAHREGVFREAQFAARVEGERVVIEEDAQGTFDPPTRERYLIVHRSERILGASRARARRYELA